MTKVYIVSSGEYPDCHIKGIFSTKELAQKYIDKYTNALKANNESGYFNEIDEHILNEDIEDNRVRYEVRVKPNETRAVVTTYKYDPLNKVISGKSFNQEIYYFVNVLAENAEHAIKIAGDLIAQFKVKSND